MEHKCSSESGQAAGRWFNQITMVTSQLNDGSKEKMGGEMNKVRPCSQPNKDDVLRVPEASIQGYSFDP